MRLRRGSGGCLVPDLAEPALGSLGDIACHLAALLDEVCGDVDTMGRARSVTQGLEWR